MDHKQRLSEIAEFLKPYQRIWENEIMLMYPDPFRDYPIEWIRELSQFRANEDVIKLEKKEYACLIKGPSLLSFFQRIEELCQFPQVQELPAFPEHRFSFLFMIPKKQHEIKRLAPYVNHFYHHHEIEKVIDIGGGIGNLAQALTNHYNLKTVSVDMDPVLQETGKERHKKNAVKGNHQVEYHTVKVSANEEKFQALLTEQSMTLGLHTCGALAVHQIQASTHKKTKGLISFGCCYDKLLREPATQNISNFSKGLGIHFNQFALTLATRAHKKMNDKDYVFKLKVKFYRYAIHFLLHDEYQRTELLNLGNSHHRLYDESFGTYALEQLRRVGIEPRHSKEELDHYFADPNRQELIRGMLAAGLIRNALGRPMEAYILLDRVCYLEEQGYKVELLEFFDESLSPRNLGIIAVR